MNRLKKLAEYAKGKTLDIGHNTNQNLHLYEAVGIDIKLSKKPDNYKAVCQADATKMPFKEQSFDSIIAGEIIEHIDNLFEFFKSCHQVLTEKGRLVISAPNSSSIIIVLANWLGIKVPYNHRNEYSIRIVELIAKESGFKKEKFIGLTNPFFLSPRLKRRCFLRIPLCLLPLSHKILYIFEKE